MNEVCNGATICSSPILAEVERGGSANESIGTIARIDTDCIKASLTLKKFDLGSLAPPSFLTQRCERYLAGPLNENGQLRRLLGWLDRQCALEGFSDNIEVAWNNRITAALGKAVLGRCKIELSSKLWKHLTADSKRELVVHEACHLFVYELHGTSITQEELKGHGKPWSELMRKCGILNPQAMACRPQTYIGTRYSAYCRCRERLITPQLAGKMAKGYVYWCGKCNSEIKAAPYEY